ncbi:DUF3152 domain-containing protein [Actinoplanes sp. NEAU-A12]|uniref:DUF3152 domain-containing protein n=1 Tax=Actinoplanes sandaracinus TaxID=3045177 RepID=A0ABT6WQB0_9ACTN|nr:DUF3152 domain-containing protein [Actinoplanes sandaracinus]MDI6101904.1 DUF3152 domain-containing protein [Actinoplanes sandaracinus]
MAPRDVPVAEPGQGGGSGSVSVPATSPAPAVSQAGPPREPVPISYPAEGEGTWRTAVGHPVTAGERGTLRRYRVLVEKGITGLEVNEFADTVSETLNDPRGWTAGGRWRMRRVGPGQPYDFTIYLATPETRDVLCGVARDGYTSCRNGDAVVINVARWVKGVPDYGASLSVYRQYVVNHEVGHRLGHGHELCPGKGQPAPVMQQQSLGLHRCTANSWPYRDGERYAGASGQYNDPTPPPDRGSAKPT